MLFAGLHRLDVILALLGPVALLLTWLLLPATGDEGAHADDSLDASGVIAELVGYEIDAEAGEGPRVVGRASTSTVRLHTAPISSEAALLWGPFPPEGQLEAGTTPEADWWVAPEAAWWLAPARPGMTLRRMHPAAPERIRLTSSRPWREGEEATLQAPCDQAHWRLTPRELPDLDGWGVEIGETSSDAGDAGDAAERNTFLVSPWHTTARAGTSQGEGLWLTQDGRTHESARLGIWSPPSPLPPAPLTPCFDDGTLLESIGPLRLLRGDVIALGRTRFLVDFPQPLEPGMGVDSPQADASLKESDLQSSPATEAGEPPLRLFHVRSPDAPWYLRNSGGADVYHPNRRALWDVPSCDGEAGELQLQLVPRTSAASSTVPASELARLDRLRFDRFERAAHHNGVPCALPAVEAGAAAAVLAVCTLDEEASLRVRLSPPADRLDAPAIPTSTSGNEAATSLSVRVESAERRQTLGVGEHVWSWIDPRSGDPDPELLLSLGGNLLRIAPAAGQRVGKRTRLGVVAYLSCILLIAAIPLTRARHYRRSFVEAQSADWREDIAWSANMGAATLQQLASITIAVLLLIGTAYHLRLAVHPQLAGKPDYLQAFLQAVLLLGPVITAAAGFAAGGLDLQRRLAWASLGASLALVAGAGWWALDAASVPESHWLTALRSAVEAPALATPLLAAAGLLLLLALVLIVVPGVWFRGMASLLSRVGQRILRWPEPWLLVLLIAGLLLGIARRSALALEIALLTAFALYGAVRWSYVREGQSASATEHRQRASRLSSFAGGLILVFLLLFFFVEAHLPLWLSTVFVLTAVFILGYAILRIKNLKLLNLARVLVIWLMLFSLGVGAAIALFSDMGSVAAWMPAMMAGAFLWLVRPEEAGRRREESEQAKVHVLLALAAGFLLLGLLDVAAVVIDKSQNPALERPRQRIELARDISYITPGEWVTEVRWLASGREATFQWVPNINSDVAIFGLAAGFGLGHAAMASIFLLLVALLCAAAADQALREARRRPGELDHDALRSAVSRTLGLLSSMVAVLLIAQWLVHLATGVVLHLPITGLVFPWLSHGNTTHILFTAAVLLPLAALSALQEGRRLS